MIRIVSKKEGFRRCGVAHSATAAYHEDDRFSKEQLAALKAEPMLIVDEGVAPPKADDDKKPAPKGK